MADFMGSPATTLLPQDPEALRLQRQRMLAEALMAQSQQPINPNRMSGRFMSAISPLEGLAKMVQAGVGAYAMRKADDRMQEMSDQRRQALVRALRGQPEPGSVPADQFGDDAEMSRMPGPFDYSKPKPAALRDPMTESVVGVTAPAVPVRGRLPQDAPPAAPDPMQTMRNELADMLESNGISPAEARAFMLQMRKSELDRAAELQAKLLEPRALPEGGSLVTGTGQVLAKGADKRRAPDLVDSGGPRDAQGNPTTIKMVIGEDGVARPIPGVQPVSRGPLAKAEANVNTKDTFENERKLRNDLKSEPIYKAHQEVRSAYDQVRASLKQGTAISDVAAATKIMKLLDPGSVVRESELGIAMASAGLLDRISNYGQMIVNGQRLTPKQRQEFQSLADEFFRMSEQQFNAKVQEYHGIAADYGLDAGRITGSNVKPQQSDPPVAPPPTDKKAPKSGYTIRR